MNLLETFEIQDKKISESQTYPFNDNIWTSPNKNVIEEKRQFNSAPRKKKEYEINIPSNDSNSQDENFYSTTYMNRDSGIINQRPSFLTHSYLPQSSAHLENQPSSTKSLSMSSAVFYPPKNFFAERYFYPYNKQIQPLTPNNGYLSNTCFSHTFPKTTTHKNNNNPSMLRTGTSFISTGSSSSIHSKEEKANDQKNREINIENILLKKETRTTIMVKKISGKYTDQNVIDEVDSKLGFGRNSKKKTYDIMYLPRSQKKNENIGYFFINFTNPLYVIDFFLKFKDVKWTGANKECQIRYAEYQGKETLLQHLERSAGIKKTPMIFESPSDPTIVDYKIKLPRKYYDLVIKFQSENLQFFEFVE